MKKTHIIAILLIAVAIGAILTSIWESNEYVTFEEAWSNPDEEVTVEGELVKDKEVNVAPNHLSFYMVDKAGDERLIVHNESIDKGKMQDFHKTESITVVGYAKGDHFHATNINYKCPSKYSEKPVETANSN